MSTIILNNNQIISFITYIVGSIIICFSMLLVGHYLGTKSIKKKKHIPYESGINSFGNARLRISAKFYIIAMLFVIFDIEAIFLYMWAISIKNTGWIGFIEICIFIFMLLISLYYLIHIKIFNFTKK